jgi:hypothetical protein
MFMPMAGLWNLLLGQDLCLFSSGSRITPDVHADGWTLEPAVGSRSLYFQLPCFITADEAPWKMDSWSIYLSVLALLW